MDALDFQNPAVITALAIGAVILWTLLRPASAAQKVQASPAKSDRGLPSSAAAGTTGDSEEASAATGKKKKKKKKSKAQKKAAAASVSATAAESAPEKEVAPAAASGGGKKKKKKKGGATNGAAASTSKKSSAAKPVAKASVTEDSDSDDERGDTISPPSAPTRPSTQLPKTQGLSKAEKKQQLIDLNDGWEIAADPKKKKKRGGGKKAAAAQAGGAAAVPAGVGEAKLSVVVEAKKIGIVIGPKGATMQSIEAATNTKLEINGSKDTNDGKPVTVSITGSKADAARAKLAVQELCKKGYTTLTQEAGFTENYTSVHPQVLSEIVGPGGRNIRAIQDKLGVKLTIPATDWRPNQPQLGQVQLARVGVAGDKDACKKAKGVVEAIAQYHHHEITHPGLIHEEVDVPHEFLHCVIGTRGSELRHIKGNYSCEVYIPNAGSYSEYVVVVGRAVQVERAIGHINKLMDRESEKSERRYDDDAEY